MGKLLYIANISLDGFTEDADGSIGWSAPNGDQVAAINAIERRIGTSLYGRRMYEAMEVWENLDTADLMPELQEFAVIWRSEAKVVFSRTLDDVSTARTTLARSFDPDAIRSLKAAADHDLGIGGAELAGEALRAGLVDEVHLFVYPLILGGGKAALPQQLCTPLELVAVDRLAQGFVHLHYAIG